MSFVNAATRRPALSERERAAVRQWVRYLAFFAVGALLSWSAFNGTPDSLFSDVGVAAPLTDGYRAWMAFMLLLAMLMGVRNRQDAGWLAVGWLLGGCGLSIPMAWAGFFASSPGAVWGLAFWCSLPGPP
jgi:hypothetical protein